MDNSMADSILKNLSTRLIKMNFSSIVFLLDIIIWLLNIQSLKNLITGKDWNALLNLAPEIMVKIYNLYFLVAFSVIWLVFKYLSKPEDADKVETTVPGLVRVCSGPKVIFENYNKFYLFLYRNIWTVLLFFIIIGDNLEKLTINRNIITSSLVILVININNLIENLKKYTYEMKANPYPISLDGVSEMDEDNSKTFKTLAQKKVGEKEYRILKITFYHSKYFGEPNVMENRYFVVRVEHSLINVVNQSNNWDEIRYSYEQLISTKKE